MRKLIAALAVGSMRRILMSILIVALIVQSGYGMPVPSSGPPRDVGPALAGGTWAEDDPELKAHMNILCWGLGMILVGIPMMSSNSDYVASIGVGIAGVGGSFMLYTIYKEGIANDKRWKPYVNHDRQ